MTKTTRRIIFYFLCAVFFISVPLVILYSMGWTLDWQNYTLVKTGGLYLKSIPPKAQIFLNNKEKNSTPYFFSRLTPKTYWVKIILPDYYSWEKNLEVKPQLVTEARNIFLLPKNPISEPVAQNVTSTIAVYLKSQSEIKKETEAFQIASSSAGWILKNNDLYFVSKVNFNLYRTDLNYSFKEQISREPLPGKSQYEIFIGPADQIAILSAENNFYLLNKDTKIFEFLNSSIQNVQFSSDGKKVLFFSDYEIWVLYLEDFLIQPYKKAGEKELITRFAQKISEALFFPDNEHIAFAVGNQIKVVELDGRDQRNMVDFLLTPSPQIYYDFKNENFYYLSQSNLFLIKLSK